MQIYLQVSNISRTLVGNQIVDHSDVVGASPVGAAPTTSSFSTYSPVKIKFEVEKIRTKGFSADFIPLVPK